MNDLTLVDGGLETSLIFHQGVDLPLFAAFPLVETDDGRAALRDYWAPYLTVAHAHDGPFAVDTPTWRANPDWAEQLGYDAAALATANAAAARFAREIAEDIGNASVTGVIGPRGDGYVVGEVMSPEDAAAYHAAQIQALAAAGVDRVAGVTFTYPEEAIGFVRAAQAVGVPSIVSFTVETDGRLPNEQSLRSAVEGVDAETDAAAAGFMINCAHPTHFDDVLDPGPWLDRITGIRANASTMSHAELDAAEELDAGDPVDLAARYLTLADRLPALAMVGGCCGTDYRHVQAISEAMAARPDAR